MNINYSNLNSILLDNVKDINIRSSWGLENVNAWKIIEDLMMLRGSECEYIEDNWRLNDAKRKRIKRISIISLWS